MYRRWTLPFGLATVVVAQLLVVLPGRAPLTIPHLLGYVLLTLAGGLFVAAGTGETVAVGDRAVPWYRLVGLADVLLAVTMVVWSVPDAAGGTTTLELLVLVASVGAALALGYVGADLAREGTATPSREGEEAGMGTRNTAE